FVGVQTDARPYYAAADALVHPALYEPFGNVNLEAMACGLPIAVSTSCGASDVVREGVNGYVLDAFDAEGFAYAIERLRDPEHAQEMGRKARETAEGFPIAAMAEQMTALYRQLLRA
ncbi:MAG: glycosyltransferase, partial [Bacillota bacterium]